MPGVGLVRISGGQRPAVRVQANPTALASYGLTLEDLRAVIGAANVNQAKGGFDGPRQAAIIGANDQLLSSREYKPLILAYRNGAPVRLSDVADVVDDAENVNQAAWMNESPAVIVNIQRQPGANVIEVVDRVKKLMPQLRSSLPAAVDISILTDRTTTIRASVWDVQIELMLAVALVVMVIFLFLRNLPATVIPSIAVPLSLVGTFGAMYLLGFSLNNLTLMALTISTGFVVDDAIVMIENVARYIEAGDSPLEAALKGSEQIGFTILSLTVSLIAVLIPLLFMGDVVGRLFREFAVTLGVTILLSAVVSLTLTPMMCAKLLKHVPEEKQGRFYLASQRVFDRTIEGYGKTLKWVLGHQTATLLIAVGTLAFTIFLYIVVPKGFFPVQDTGAILGVSEAPQSISFSAMAKRQAGAGRNHPQGPGGREPVVVHRGGRDERVAEHRADPDQPQAPGRTGCERERGHPPPAAGTGASRRHHAVHAAGPGPFGRGPREPDAIPVHAGGPRSGRAFPPGPPAGRPAAHASRAARRQQRHAERGVASLAGDRPGHGLTAWHHAADDRRYALRRLRPAAGLHDLHAAQPVPRRPGSQARLSGQPDRSRRDLSPRRERRPGAVERDRAIVRNDGAARHQPPGPVPRGHAFVQPGAGRFAGRGRRRRSKESWGGWGSPKASGAAFQGTAAAFHSSLSNEPLLILAALVTVYIVLGVLYESYIHPVTILSTLPSAGVGALLALLLCRTEFSVIALIGLILLIGIVKKNAIMMIDFALEAERKEGKGPVEAIYQACLIRFRPIMMTTMAALLGALPLALGRGVGSELRRPLGISIVGGLIFSQVLTLYTTPVIYIWFDRLSRRLRGVPKGGHAGNGDYGAET